MFSGIQYALILASQSPRRKQLLAACNIPFSVVVQPTNETFPATLPVTEVPTYIALQKAVATFEHHILPQNTLLIAADTVVVLDDEIIGKPDNEEHAIDILQKLSGKKHRVITGVVLMNTTQKTTTLTAITDVYFKPLTLEQIMYYIDTYKPYDKAGAYAIQEWIGMVGIEKIVGDYYNVMGLPISQVVQAIAEF